MHSNHRTIIVTGLIAAFGIFLIPPWQRSGYCLIFSPPAFSPGVDVQRLGIEILMLAILIGIAWLVVPSQTTPVSDALTQKPFTLDSKTKIAIAAVVFIALGYAGYQNWAKAQQLKRAMQTEQMELENRQRLLEEHRKAALEASAQTKLAEERQRAQQEKEKQAFVKKLQSYAAPKILLIADPIHAGVQTYLHSFWKNDQLIYCLSLRGTPEALEFAADENQAIEIRVQNTDGLDLFVLSFNSDALKPIKNKTGKITSLATERHSVDCDLKTYEKISLVKLRY